MKAQPLADEAEHLAVQQILPWYAAGTLSATEQDRVVRHLDTCAACRADVAQQRHVMLAEPAPPDGLDAEAALARLMPRLDQAAQPAANSTVANLTDKAEAVGSAAGMRIVPDGAAAACTSGGMRSGPTDALWRSMLRRLMETFDRGGWRNWALAAQLMVIAGLSVLLWPAGSGQDAAYPQYRALGSGAVAAPDVVVMFQPDARFEQVQRVLQASGARIVDGPTVTGAYLVDVDAARMPQLLAALRADPAVRLAEPLGAGAVP